ncbi:hypothetical protein BJX99DRAFT_163418 [Aspergillus californicus]
MPKRHNPVADIFKKHPVKRLRRFQPTSASPPEYNEHAMENGRRYRGHKSEFPFPNDDEATRAYSCLNTVWFFLLRDAGHELISAPVTEGKGKGRNLKVLDVGARGITWMSELDDRYPDVRVTVIDPGCAWLYPTDVTVHHELKGGGKTEGEGSTSGGWPFTARQAFHYIRGLALWGMISDYEALYAKTYRHLLPGGWVEIRDNDMQFFTDTPSAEKEEKLASLRRWEKLIAEAAEKFGKPINVSARHKAWMEQAGFTEVREEVFKIPFGA